MKMTSEEKKILIQELLSSKKLVEDVYYKLLRDLGAMPALSAPLKTFSRTGWLKIVGSSLYDSITIRNSNTVIKLLHSSKL